jgi:predicted site-specific integrase-resolvase
MDGKAALYARVSSHDHKADLNRQVARLGAFAAASGLTAYLCASLAKVRKLTSHFLGLQCGPSERYRSSNCVGAFVCLFNDLE